MRRLLRSRLWLLLLPLTAAVYSACDVECPSGTVQVAGTCQRSDQTGAKKPDAGEADTGQRSDELAITCQPGKEHQCQGKQLMVCDRKGKSFVAQSECSSEAACDADEGSCRQDECDVGSYRCDHDILVQCKSAQGWSFMAQCDPGQCNAGQKACNHCAPGEKKCDGDSVLACDQAGENYERTGCSTDTPHCSEGMCVRCAPGKDCALGCEKDLDPCALDGGSMGVCAGGMCTHPKSAHGKDRLTRGERLGPGENLVNGRYRLIYQGDGDLVLYHDRTRIWENLAVSLPPQTPPGQFGMEPDGNVVIRNADGKLIWRSGTSCFGQYLSVLNNGNVCIYDAGDRVVWCSGTADR